MGKYNHKTTDGGALSTTTNGWSWNTCKLLFGQAARNITQCIKTASNFFAVFFFFFVQAAEQVPFVYQINGFQQWKQKEKKEENFLFRFFSDWMKSLLVELHKLFLPPIAVLNQHQCFCVYIKLALMMLLLECSKLSFLTKAPVICL